MMQLKNKVKSLIFGAIIRIARLLHSYTGNDAYGFISNPANRKLKTDLENYYYDINKYQKYSTSNTIPKDELNLVSRIIAHYHVIEKGLSMPDIRLGFGKDLVNSLILHLEQYFINGFNPECHQIQVALKVLNEYNEFHLKNKFKIDNTERILKIWENYRKDLTITGGVKVINKENYIEAGKSDFYQMAMARCSIRNFNDKPVEPNAISDCIKIAITTPSVCNRQSWSTISIFNASLISDVLNLQNGNRGFGHLIKCLIIVKANLRHFYKIEERNQAFIDSGMFGMNLIFAIQYHGLGSVVLNWASNHEQDTALHKLLNINEEEIVSMIIGIGNIKDQFSVPFSTRKCIEEINIEIK